MVRIVGGSQTAMERYLPVAPLRVYAALQNAARTRFTLTRSDDFTMSVEFSSGASAFTWGEKFTAQVTSAQSGATIRVDGVGKVGGQLQQNARLHRLINQLLEDVAAQLRPEWVADPTGRYELRYFDGEGWTEHVATAGVVGIDPL
jgi:hypothetical protein